MHFNVLDWPSCVQVHTLGVKLRQIELTNNFLVVLLENKIKTSVSIQFSRYLPVLHANELNVAKSGDRLIVD